MNRLHPAFMEDHTTKLHLFIVGVGNVGKKLLEQIRQQQNYLLDKLHINIRVIGLANSKKMLFSEKGIDLNQWEILLEKQGVKSGLDDFYKKVKELNLRNSVFIDNTANKDVAEEYARYLQDSVAIVACNKIACSSDYKYYNNLKVLSKKYKAPFLFETNVGAGLPIIHTLNNLIASGDQVTEIQAVLSGSLNFIFNHFNHENSFHDVVEQAGLEGYTEPDPRIDLRGTDVRRKILILMRESGMEAELEDIKNESFLPESSMNSESVSEFMNTLKKEKKHFNSLLEAAERENCKLKYVATLKNGKARVGLQHIPKEHPFYTLEGKDNIVLFYTNRYKEQPLIIKGAGAGAEVTASGIFGDIIKTGNK